MLLVHTHIDPPQTNRCRANTSQHTPLDLHTPPRVAHTHNHVPYGHNTSVRLHMARASNVVRIFSHAYINRISPQAITCQSARTHSRRPHGGSRPSPSVTAYCNRSAIYGLAQASHTPPTSIQHARLQANPTHVKPICIKSIQQNGIATRIGHRHGATVARIIRPRPRRTV